VGAKPIFADIEDKTFGLNPEDVRDKITKKTKAIIPVHYGGSPCLIRELKEIAEDRGLLLIEDAAEAFGATVKNKKVGTFGDSGVLSFCQNKIITTGEGGAVVTDSKEIYEKLKLIRSHGRLESLDYFSSSEYMDYVALGYNFRMPNIIAALGISQLKKADKIIAMRRKNVQYFTKKLFKVKEVAPPITLDNYFHVYQIFTIRVTSENGVRDNLADHLAKKGVMTKVFFYPVHLTHFYRNELGYRVKLPVTEKVSKEVLSLPMYPSLTNVEMDYIAGAVNAFFEAAG
jgi:perosamine synthetase